MSFQSLFDKYKNKYLEYEQTAGGQNSNEMFIQGIGEHSQMGKNILINNTSSSTHYLNIQCSDLDIVITVGKTSVYSPLIVFSYRNNASNKKVDITLKKIPVIDEKQNVTFTEWRIIDNKSILPLDSDDLHIIRSACTKLISTEKWKTTVYNFDIYNLINSVLQ